MKPIMTKTLALLGFAIALAACNQQFKASNFNPSSSDPLYSKGGREHLVQFTAVLRTEFKSLDKIPQTEWERNNFIQYEIKPTLAYLFGPLTTRELGGVQKGENVSAVWDKAFVNNSGTVDLPYNYQGIWIITPELSAKGEFVLPLPLHRDLVFTPSWKACGDSDPEHATQSFLWYFWDPNRSGCDNVLGTHFQEITVQLGAQTPQTKQSYPEYTKMIRKVNGQQELAMTFAFGYVSDPANPNPMQDQDAGAYEFRRFRKYVRDTVMPLGFKEIPLKKADFQGASNPDLVIGTRYQGTKNQINFRINIVMAADIDQMVLFAQSFSRFHDSFFGWFGHSRVGGGFDAQKFGNILRSNPSIYSVIPDYQMIYWAGCNSYSYYTMPFFKFKADINPADPRGTKGLDIIANALPSLFSFNAYNAQVTFNAMLNWEKRTSYQSMVNQIEDHGMQTYGTRVIVNVLGDEDNQ